MTPLPEGTLEYHLKQGGIEAVLLLDRSWGRLTSREYDLIKKAWLLGLQTGKKIAKKP